jgi:23S rRNA (guanosine2251-2'-O)-methyltransferase
MPLIWGRHPVLEALRAGRPIDRLYLAEGARPVGVLGELIALGRERAVPTQSIDRRALDRLSEGANHQGVIAEVASYRYRSLDDLIAAGAAGPGLPLIVALDSLEDPQNFGTLLRTADAVGATGVIIPQHRAVGVTPAVEKASAGAVEYVAIARATNLGKAVASLKEQGYWAVGLDEAATERYDRFRVDVPLVLVVGAEGKGLGRLVREACDVVVRLPQRGHISSLNAAVAGSIVLYEIQRRRGWT